MRDELTILTFQKRSFWTALALASIVFACNSWIVSSLAQPVGLSDTASAQTVRIGVFSLFRPHELVLRAASEKDLVVELGGRTQMLRGDGHGFVLRVSDGEVELRSEGMSLHGISLRTHASNSGALGFGPLWLEVPGKLRRMYFGSLEVRARGEILEAIVTMPLETAVASVVQAESPPGAGMEALKAQAVAARSFLVAREARHSDFDFCDTTHCQFLRSPPAAGSEAEKATRETTGLVLTWHDSSQEQDRTLAAMYARSCGGRTRTLREIGVASKGYPYYAVHCVYCSHHPEIWRRAAPIETGELSESSRGEPITERQRLTFNRIHGWSALPSAAESSTDNSIEPNARWVNGRGVGHGIGLCQLGAADMARHGADFATILAHYYPNTRLAQMPQF